jgi:hypothetical protein
VGVNYSLFSLIALKQLMSQAAWESDVAPNKLSFKQKVYILQRKRPQFKAFSPSEDEIG